tara:strand:+ start:3076 stop:3729 length:654 start_codon:yes stop_codon:yes gene_type:complete
MCRNLAYFSIELRIILIIILAEIYTSLSLRSFIRIYSIEYFLDNQCYKLAKCLKKLFKYQSNCYDYKELVLVTRLQKGGGLGDIYKKVIKGKKIYTLSTSIFDFRAVNENKNTAKTKIIKISIFGIIPRIKTILTYISNPNLQKIHVLNDSCDPLIYISYLICSRDYGDFVFYHHADHTFCFGALEKKWIHIDLFQNQFHICRKRLDPIFYSMINFL